MADKLMYITNDDTQNYHFCRLQLVVEMIGLLTKRTNQSKLIKVPKVVKPTKMKYKTLGTNIINSPFSLLSDL